MGKKSPASRPPWDWFSAIVVVLLVWVAAVRLVITKWTPDLNFTETLGVLGVVLGLALGQSAFRRGAVRWLVVLYSLVILPWQLTAAVEAEADALERLAIVGSRLWFALGEFFTRKPVDDSLLFVAFVSLAFWIIGTTAGYALARRNNTLGAIIPAGVAMILVQVYDGFISIRIWGLAVYAFLALTLLGRGYFRKSRETWREQRVLVTGESGEEFLLSLIAVAAVSVFIAWTLPGSIESLRSAADTWEDVSRPVRERLTNAVTSLDSPYGTGGRGDFYSEDLFLGRTAAIGDSTVFTVRVNSTTGRPPLRYYWRGRVYDTYEDGEWVNRSRASRDFEPETDEVSLPLVAYSQEEARLTFTLLLSRQRLLYAPPGTDWVNRPARVYAEVIPGRREDISAWMADPSLAGGDRYQVHAWVTNPTVEELRNTGTDYPAWVTDRYLDVPETLLPSFRSLALQAAEGQPTPFDRTQAITAWLREEIEYSTSLETPPRGVDPLYWVLTQYKKGFCMYYASAEVLMLRSIGIPARMAVGFAQGVRDDETGLFTVRRLDSHAWPEVYFPGVGWVEFEPTSNQAPLVRPAVPQAVPTPIGGPDGLGLGEGRERDEIDRLADVQNIDLVTTPFRQTPLGRLLFFGMGLAAAAALILLARRFNFFERLPAVIATAYARSGLKPPGWVNRWERWVHLGSIERSFQAVNFSLRTLGKPQRGHVTPAERAAVLQEMLPSESDLIQDLLVEHQSALYTTRSGDAGRARRLAWRLVKQTLLARLRNEWERFDRRFGNFG